MLSSLMGLVRMEESCVPMSPALVSKSIPPSLPLSLPPLQTDIITPMLPDLNQGLMIERQVWPSVWVLYMQCTYRVTGRHGSIIPEYYENNRYWGEFRSNRNSKVKVNERPLNYLRYALRAPISGNESFFPSLDKRSPAESRDYWQLGNVLTWFTISITN